MGLDQYAYRRAKGVKRDDMQQIAYWRKHNRLQGWMEARWRAKGQPEEAVFNCISFRLKKKDLEALAVDIITDNLPKTEGFFFGDDSKDYYMKEDLLFVTDSLRAIQAGDKIYYDSWW